MAKVKKPAAKRAAKKPTTFKSLKAAARAIKRKAAKAPKKLDRNTPAQKDVIIARVEAADRVQLVTPKGFPPRRADTRWPKEITVGKRHRKDFGNLQELAASIDDRGGLIQPIAITSSNVLVAGERRMRAWPLTKFSADPMPVRVLDVDSIVAGEWDENAKRKDFTPSEAAIISDEIARQLSRMAKERQRGGKKVEGAEKGKSSEHAARATGFAKRTIDKAKAVMQAAEQDPERFGKLQADMDRTGKVDGPFKRLQVMQQTDALRKAPPPLPMMGPYAAMLVDFPVTGDVDKDQETIDATGRSFRGYPEMSIAECAKFAREKLLPILAPDCTVWLTFPNYHIVNGSAHEIIEGFGAEFKPATMLSWEKDKLGRGKILRDQTEHAIVIYRGKPTHNCLGEDPPTTWLKATRRENSRKPDELYDRIERVCPASRYAEIFSRGGRNEKWDCHGDQVGKFAPEVAKAAQDAILKEIQLTPGQQLLRVLEAIEKGETPDLRLVSAEVGERLNGLISGKKTFKLNRAGRCEIGFLREAVAEYEHDQDAGLGNALASEAPPDVKPQRFRFVKSGDNKATSKGLNGLPFKNIAKISNWANPYDAQPFGGATQSERAGLYRDMLKDPESRRAEWVRDHIAGLRGFNLACDCVAEEPCHHDVLIELANPEFFTTPTADEPAAQPDAEAGPLLAAASDVLPDAAEAAIDEGSRAEPPAQGNASAGGSDNEMPDIPAFLRRQEQTEAAE